MLLGAAPHGSRRMLRASGMADTCRDTCCRCIGLKKSSEPEIYNAIRFGSVLENVVFDEFTREVDFDSK